MPGIVETGTVGLWSLVTGLWNGTAKSARKSVASASGVRRQVFPSALRSRAILPVVVELRRLPCWVDARHGTYSAHAEA